MTTLQDLFEEYPKPLPQADVQLAIRELGRLTKANVMLRRASFHFTREHDAILKQHEALTEKRRALLASSSTTPSAEGDPEEGKHNAEEPQRKREREAPCSEPPPPHEASSTATAPVAAAPRRRRFVQSEAAVLGLQKLKASNDKVQEALSGTNPMERAKLQREVQLAALADEFASVDAARRKAKAAAAEVATKIAALEPLLAALSSAVTMADTAEAEYAASFFLRADGGDDVPYEIFFSPSTHTDETIEVIRWQVQQQLEGYLHFRERFDAAIRATQVERDESAPSGLHVAGAADRRENGAGEPAGRGGGASTALSLEEVSHIVFHGFQDPVQELPEKTAASDDSGGLAPTVSSALGLTKETTELLGGAALAALDEFE